MRAYEQRPLPTTGAFLILNLTNDHNRGQKLPIITINQAETHNLIDCQTALLKSRLGEEYFTDEDVALSVLSEGIAAGEIFVATDDTNQCVGFIWYIQEGAFHGFPYLHIIAVKEALRGKGIGQQLLAYFEKRVFTDYDKVFLVVADFNPSAKRLYERLGYRQVGAIPNLYKEGVTEYLMMKEK